MFASDEIESFRRDGYLIVRGMGGASLRERMLRATLHGLRERLEPIEYEADVHYPGAPESRDSEGGHTIRRLRQAIGRDPAFLEWVAGDDVAERVRDLLGPDVVMPLAHHNCVMTKHPVFGTATDWHQDFRYWSYQRRELVSVWLALGHERPENGCLRLIPGSHRATLERWRFDDQDFFLEDLPENRELVESSIDAVLEPGDVLFFHCRTLHSAGPNHAGETKYSVVFTFRPADDAPIPGSRSAELPELLLPAPKTCDADGAASPLAAERH